MTEDKTDKILPQQVIASLKEELSVRDAQITIFEDRVANLSKKAKEADELGVSVNALKMEHADLERSVRILKQENDRLEKIDIEFQMSRAELEQSQRALHYEKMKKAPMGIIGRIIIFGNMISGAVGLLIILSVIGITLISPLYGPGTEVVIPPVLENWGGIVLGFYFGTFMGLVKDFMGQAGATKSTDAPQDRNPAAL